jgi:hypothetical protein
LHLGAQIIDLILHVQDAANAFEIDALVLGQPLDQPQSRNVTCRVAPAPLGRASRGDQAHAVIGAECLGMHAREMGCHRDDKDWRIMIDSLRKL